MRKALIGLILAATAMTPIAAGAQDRSRERAERVRQLEERGQEQVERRAQRAERREQRQEARQQQVQPQPRQERRAERRQRVQRQQPAAVAQHRGADHRSASQAWQGDPNDPRRRHYEQLERRNQARYGTRSDGDHGDHSHDGDRRRGEHREVHRDLRREHRDLHRSDPTRREHRQWHRQAERDHRQIHRGEHRDLHAGNPTRREHRNWHREWDRSWRTDRRYDWNRWRYSNRHLYRLPSYYSPYRNHRYSRFSIGFFLQPLFYNQRYWIGDPWQYRLPHAPYGTQWVRYYNDVLLVDIYTGEVIDVIYDFFW